MADSEHDGSGERRTARRRRSAQHDEHDSTIEVQGEASVQDKERSGVWTTDGSRATTTLVASTFTDHGMSASVGSSHVPESKNVGGVPAVPATGLGLQVKDERGEPNTGAEKHDMLPSLCLDTSSTTAGPSTQALWSPKSSHNSFSPLFPVHGPSRAATVGASLSSRTRDRGYSLRRSLFARNIPRHGEHDGSGIELQPAGSSEPVPGPLQAIGKRGACDKSGTIVTMTPALKDTDEPELPPRPMKKSHGLASLPHYETWVNQKISRTILPAQARVLYRKLYKAILRINEIPPSQDGRHIDLDVTRKKSPTDERTGRLYIDNTIRSSRYTLWNFFPRQLFAQFSKLANFYFLCVSILQMIPGLSTTGTYTTIVPLLFFVSISMAKEGYDDLRRYRLDKAENNRSVSVLHACRSTAEGPKDTASVAKGSKHWAQTKWMDVQVGDIVRLERNEPAPADLAILHAQGPNGTAYIETMALDGETNLKTKQPSPALAKKCQTVDDIAQCDAHFVVEDPNLDLYRFEGKVIVADERAPLTNNEIVYRGSVLRNTSEAFCMVIYTGEECKIRMNATKNPRIKAPALQAVVNKIVVIIVIFVLALAIFNTVAYKVWQESKEEKAWYLIDARVSFFPSLTSFIIMFNTMIPLSLYVSLEIVKVCQMYFLNDIDMYDEASNTPMEARTSTINEELGQVSYIFSDKTGTLTNNEMRFRKMSVAGTAWLHDPDLRQEAVEEALRRTSLKKNFSKGKRPAWRRSNVSSASRTPKPPRMSEDAGASSPIVARNSSITSRWKSSAHPSKAQPELRTTELLQYLQNRPHTLFARKARFFILCMALCHTCLPEMGENGRVGFQATSPDEVALVQAAQELGYVVIDRQSEIITIKTLPHDGHSDAVLETYQILDVIEFSSKRKRMSIIVRMPDGRICIFTKGADSAVVGLLRLADLALDKALDVERSANERKSLEAQEAIRRNSEQHSRKNSLTRTSFNLGRSSLGGIARPSMTAKRLQPIRDELDSWLKDRETDVDMFRLSNDGIHSPLRSSANFGARRSLAYIQGRRPSSQQEAGDDLINESQVVDDAAVFGRCFQHINDFATEGLRTLLYGFKYINEQEYSMWKKVYLDASTSLVDREDMMDKASELVEQGLELAGATAIEDKLQEGVPEAVDKLRRANIKMWMLTGDKRETAITVARAVRLIKDYSSVTVLDHGTGDVNQRIAAAIIDTNRGTVAHSVVVIDGQTLSIIEADETVKNLFIDLAILVDSVICCRASPSQKASLVRAIRRKVKSITLAIGDGANDIAMIQEANIGIGITGKEGLQAARCSDYSIAQFRFLLKLLLVHGRWNYIRTCRYTLGTFWKEMLFYLTQALYQRYAGYTGTSLYESWSLSMFNTLFTSLPVIFYGIFEKDLSASTLLAVPELYTIGQRNGGFNLRIYLGWVFMAASEAMVVFFIMLGLYGHALFTLDNGLYAMGDLTFTACIIIIATKIQFLELHNKSITCAIAMFLSIGGWFLWNIILASVYSKNTIYNVKDGFFHRFGRNLLWWLTLILIIASVAVFEIGIRVLRMAWMSSDVDTFHELEKDEAIKQRFEEASRMEMWMSLNPKPQGSGVAITQDELDRPRTVEEEERREDEVQELLNRPRVMKGDSSDGMRRRHSSAEAKSGGEHLETVVSVDDYDRHGPEQSQEASASRRSTDIQELLRRGFGSIRKSRDF